MNYYISRLSAAADPVKVAVKVQEMPVQSESPNSELLLGGALVATAIWLLGQGLHNL